MARDTWGAPSGGWPTFGPDGKRIRDDVADALVLVPMNGIEIESGETVEFTTTMDLT